MVDNVGRVELLIGAISAAIASLLTILLTKGVSAWMVYKKDNRIDIVRDAASIESGYKFIIAKQDQRISQLEGEVKELRDRTNREWLVLEKEHNECEKKYAVLLVRVQTLESQLERRITTHPPC